MPIALQILVNNLHAKIMDCQNELMIGSVIFEVLQYNFIQLKYPPIKNQSANANLTNIHAVIINHFLTANESFQANTA